MITIPETDTTVLHTTERDRSRTTDIPTSEPDVFLFVSTFHHKERRQYRTHVGGVRVSQETTGAGHGYGVRSSSLFDFVTVQVVDAGPRFSPRNLHDAHRDALRQVSDLIVLDPGPLQALLAKIPPRD